MFNKMKRIFNMNGTGLVLVQQDEAYFGDLWLTKKDESVNHVGDLSLKGFSKKQKEVLRDFAGGVRQAHDQEITRLQKEVHSLSPNYTIDYNPNSFTEDGDFVLNIKESNVYPNSKSNYYSHYRCENKAEAEKKAKQLIKLCEENS